MSVRRISNVFLPFILVMASLILTQPAYAATQWRHFCAKKGAGLCANATVHGPVLSSHHATGEGEDGELWAAETYNGCSGKDKVETTLDGDPTDCPFTSAGLDRQYHNHIIYKLHGKVSGCIGAITDGLSGYEARDVTCSKDSQGPVFVQAGKYGWANVVATNKGSLGGALLLCSTGKANSQMEYDIFARNRCQLAFTK